MTRRPKTKRKPTSTVGKDASPRGGLKTKQSKAANGEKLASIGHQQTKLSFGPTTVAEKTVPPTPKQASAEVTIAITPEPSTGVAKLPPKPLPTIEEPTDNVTPTKKHKKTKKTRQVHLDPLTQNNLSELKPAAKTTPKKTKWNDKPKGYQEIRYRGVIDVPPSDKPFQDFVVLMTVYFATVQATVGKNIFLAPWDAEQEATFPPIKTKDNVPDSRESLGIYLGNYINPKEDGSKIYLNLRWITFKDTAVPLERIGMELADALPRLQMAMNRQPQPCQSAKSSCIGWFMYSSKQINSKAFVIETKAALGIPEDVEIGISYRAITNEFGKRPRFNREDPSPAAIHLDIDERFYMIFQPKASSLWRKNSKKRLPNGVQLRLVPCFSSPIGKSMTDDIRSDAKTLAERQGYFVSEHIRPIDFHFISLLDTPIANNMTLRRAMMSRAPKDRPASRLIHNVDQSWNQASKYIVTTVIGREAEANRFLTNLIPEMLHVYGPEAAKWFTSIGLSIYQHVKYDSKTGRTTSANAKESAALVKEDLWDLSDKWQTLAEADNSKQQRPETTALNGSSSLNSPDATPASTEKESIEVPILERLTSDKSVASFRGTFGRATDSDDEREDASAAAAAAAEPPTVITGTQFVFSAEQVKRDHEKALAGSESDGRSMSTAGKTTDSTRLKLKEAQEQIADLRLALARKPLEVTLAHNNNDMDIETEEVRITGNANDTSPHGPSLTAYQYLSSNLPAPTNATDGGTETKTSESMDTDDELLTEYQVLQAALNRQPQESILADADAMEEDDFSAVYMGNNLPPLPASTSSEDTSSSPSGDATSESTSTSSSASSSSEDTLDTQELMDKLSSNPYNALRQNQKPKNLTKIDETSGSQSDSASRQSSGQDSGSVKDHLPTDPTGNAGVAKIDAGHGD
jgi:hypothetical protein